MFFNKEKDLIHRIVNLILIIWLVVAIFIFYSSTVDILIKEKELTYDEYELIYCNNQDENELISDCESDYQRYVINKKDDNYYYKKSLIYAIGNVIIVGSFLYLLNKKRD